MTQHSVMKHLTRHSITKWLLVLCLMAGLSACSDGQSADKQAASEATPVFVSLQGSNKVEDLKTGETWAIPSAHYIAVSHDGHYLLASSVGKRFVTLVDLTRDKTLGQFDVGAVPQGVMIDPAGKLGLAVGAKDGTVTFIRLDANKVIKTLAVGQNPHNAVFSSDGRLAYVSLQGEGQIAVLDTKTLTKIGSFAAGLPHPHNLVLSPDDKQLWIRGLNGKVSLVKLSKHKVIKVFDVGPSHAGITWVPHHHLVVTGAIGGDKVTLIDARTLRTVGRITVGQGPHGVHTSPDGARVYVGVMGTNKVAVINTAKRKVIKQLEVKGEQPFWVTTP